MRTFEAIAGILILFIVLLDAFEAIILPRTIRRRYRLTRIFYRSTWPPWRAIGRQFKSNRSRETFLSFFGPLSLILLLSVWATGLIVGFAFVLLAAGPPAVPYSVPYNFVSTLYISGTNFFTLGLEDVVPRTQSARFLTVFEAGTGFGFLAIVIGYLPVIYQAFSRREVAVVLLDARAGSPPTAAELLRRHSHRGGMDALKRVFLEWERSSAEILESHISYPVLPYYRSQHDNQSWLAALTAILDACAFTITSMDDVCTKQAQLTFATARHAVVDLVQVFRSTPTPPKHDRLPPEELRRFREMMTKAGLTFHSGHVEDKKLGSLREMYEPYVNALAELMAIPLPPWIHTPAVIENWRTSAWGRISGALRGESGSALGDEHL
jgi:hypothetical protein